MLQGSMPAHALLRAGWFASGLVNRGFAIFFKGFNWTFDRTISGYGRGVSLLLRGSVIAGQAVRAGGRVTERVADGDGELVRCDVWLRVEGAPEGGTVLSGQAEVRCPAGTSR